MFQVRSKLKNADNFGILVGRVVKVLNKFKFNRSQLGTIVLISVYKKNPLKVKVKRVLYKALIVNVKNKIKRWDGTSIRFDDNKFIPLSNNFEFLGSNLKSLMPIELIHLKKYNKDLVFKKIILMSRGLV